MSVCSIPIGQTLEIDISVDTMSETLMALRSLSA